MNDQIEARLRDDFQESMLDRWDKKSLRKFKGLVLMCGSGDGSHENDFSIKLHYYESPQRVQREMSLTEKELFRDLRAHTGYYEFINEVPSEKTVVTLYSFFDVPEFVTQEEYFGCCKPSRLNVCVFSFFTFNSLSCFKFPSFTYLEVLQLNFSFYAMDFQACRRLKLVVFKGAKRDKEFFEWLLRFFVYNHSVVEIRYEKCERSKHFAFMQNMVQRILDQNLKHLNIWRRNCNLFILCATFLVPCLPKDVRFIILGLLKQHRGMPYFITEQDRKERKEIGDCLDD